MAPELREAIQKSLDWIEMHLRAEIAAQELSALAGFSHYHYCRVFEAVMGMSVMRYVTRRRLWHAIYAISEGMKTTEAALEYGFDTHAGFYKAFRREFGCSPSQYIRTHCVARPQRVNLQEEIRMIEPKQIEQALGRWGLDGAPVEKVYYENTGHCSETTFMIDERMYLKASQRTGELARQLALQKVLAQKGLAAEGILTQDGEPIVRVGELDFILLPRMEGKPVNAMQMVKEPQTAWALGEGIARLHGALAECDRTLCVREDMRKTIREWALPTACKAMALDEAWAKEYETRFERRYPSLKEQIIHRDPNPDNILMEAGRVIGFLDFELSRILPRIFDICYAATGILCDTFTRLDGEGQKRWFETARQVWKGYDAYTALSDEERQALPDMTIAIQLICVAAFSGTDKFAQLAEINRQMLKLMLENEACLHI